MKRGIEADEHHAVSNPRPFAAWNGVIITVPEHDHVRRAHVNALDQRFVVLQDQLQIIVEFRLDVLRRIGRLGMAYIEEIQKSRDSVAATEHVVDAGREQKCVRLS